MTTCRKEEIPPASYLTSSASSFNESAISPETISSVSYSEGSLNPGQSYTVNCSNNLFDIVFVTLSTLDSALNYSSLCSLP
jgi:hypothetical protein